MSVVFMAEHVTKKVIFNVNMKGMTGEEGRGGGREFVCYVLPLYHPIMLLLLLLLLLLLHGMREEMV